MIAAVVRQEHAGVVSWHGEPCQKVHDFFLGKLQEHAALFVSSATDVTNQIRGNLGEFITFWIGIENDHSPPVRPFKPANAFQPLGRQSRAGLDLLWVFFGHDQAEDYAVLQEVKTTGGLDLSYADQLPIDYDKLFGTDPHFSLHTRLLEAKNELEFIHREPLLAPRLTQLAGATPGACSKVRLVPTLVHDEAAEDHERVLQAVRATIVGGGWEDQYVEAWSIALDHLNDRLLRLAMGHP